MLKHLLGYVALIITSHVCAQKTVYLPLYIQDINTAEGSQFTWDKTAESENFVLIWGNTVGTNPEVFTEIPDLQFNPDTILETLEYIYERFENFGFIDDSAGTNLSLYKIPVIMLNTWGPGIGEGFAFGGDVDGVIGAFWVHPIAMHGGGVAAHELAHSMQAQVNIDYRSKHGLGLVWQNAGIFWETHANFMRNLLYPEAVSAWGMDVYHVETLGDWKNAYESYAYLFGIMEEDGIEKINNMWRLSMSGEYPLQTYKRLGNYDQHEFNDKMFRYARRMATYDFPSNNTGDHFRQKRGEDLMYWLPSVQATYTILKQIEGSETRYEVPVEISPEEYGYNVIPLYADDTSCTIIVKFKGHSEVHPHAGWRYGFVTAHADGSVSRYSPVYSDHTSEINFTMEDHETNLYLVVMGAPVDDIQTNTSNDTWHGYPKHFRYPYELNITGAKPEGFQDPVLFRAQLKSNGHLHGNGGGWVHNDASVDNTVYVGPTAIVTGSSVLTGSVRIENTALVNNAVIEENVRVLENAFVNGGHYSGNAVIRGQAFAESVTMTGDAQVNMRAKVTNYTLSGNIEVGGDVVVYNAEGDCDNGVYYRLTNYYDDKLLECDGRTADHPVNADVNETYSLFSEEEMKMLCDCNNLPDCLVSKVKDVSPGFVLSIHPNPVYENLIIKEDHNDRFVEIVIINAVGQIVLKEDYDNDESIAVGSLPIGIYFLQARNDNGRLFTGRFVKQ